MSLRHLSVAVLFSIPSAVAEGAPSTTVHEDFQHWTDDRGRLLRC